MEACDAANAIHSTFPDLGEVPVRSLKHDRSHWLFAHGDRTFCFPRKAADSRVHEREMRLLPLLASRLPAPVPFPRWIGEWGGRPFWGYPAIEGNALREGTLFGPSGGKIARDIGRFLTVLHDFPVDEAARVLDAPLLENLPNPGEWLEDIRMRVFPRLSATLRVAVDSGFTRYTRDYRALSPCLVHNDLRFDHMLERYGRLAGVISFGESALSDSASDFAGLLAGGGWHAVDDIARFYARPIGEGFQERVEFYYWTAPLREIVYGVDYDEERYVGLGRSELAQRMREVGILPA